MDRAPPAPWHRLRHARGTASDVPGLIEALRGSDHARALSELLQTVYARGAVFPATPPAVPLLVDVACDPDTPNRVAVLELLRLIAHGRSALDMQRDFLGALSGGQDADVLRQELDAVRAVERAMVRDAWRLEDLLDDADPDVAVQAAWTLSVCDQALPDRPAASPALRATLLFTSLVADPLEARGRALDALEQETGLVQLAAALGCAWNLLPPLPVAVPDVLLGWLGQDGAQALPWMGDPRVELASALTRCGRDHPDRVIEGLLAALETKQVRAATAADPLLVLAFPDGPPTDLAPRQARVLRALAARAWRNRRGTWRVNLRLAAQLRAVGLEGAAKSLVGAPQVVAG